MAYYKELNDIAYSVIGEMFLRNQNLCKLLFCYPKNQDNNYDPYAHSDIPDTNKLFMNHIFPMPKLPDASLDKTGYITVVLSGGYSPEENSGFRYVDLLIDIIFHLDVWNIKGGFRPYKVMNEIDKMLNNQQTDLPIVNRPNLIGFQPRDYSNFFYGFQMRYQLSVNSNIDCISLPKNLNIEEQQSKSLDNLPKYDFRPKCLNLKN